MCVGTVDGHLFGSSLLNLLTVSVDKSLRSGNAWVGVCVCVASNIICATWEEYVFCFFTFFCVASNIICATWEEYVFCFLLSSVLQVILYVLRGKNTCFVFLLLCCK